MTVRRQAIVVVSDSDLAETLVAWLSAGGYGARVIRTFAAARAELDGAAPDLLVAQIKLGAYNGLHLAIRLRSRGAKTPVVLVGDPDPVLQGEAERHHASYLTMPLDEQLVLDTVHRAEAEYRPTRRSPRKRVPMLDALVNDVQARVLDVSYEGLRLQVSDQQPATIPPYFMLRIPMFNLSCRAQRVWTLDPPGSSGLWCGAAIVGADPAGAVAWRALVDSVPGWTLLAH
jgi:FixJ family two-component response regulator